MYLIWATLKLKMLWFPASIVTFADVKSTYDELIEIFREDKFTRLPLFEETTDNVIGTDRHERPSAI